MMLQEDYVVWPPVVRFCLNVMGFKKTACTIQKGNLDLIFIKGNSCLDPCQRKVLKKSSFPEVFWTFFLAETVQFYSFQFNRVKITASCSDV